MKNWKAPLIVLLLLAGITFIVLPKLRPRNLINKSLGSFHGASVFLITIDTTRADRLGAYGSTAGLTPYLDRLAAEGTVFTQAQAVAPLTLPSHASILTGLLPLHHGVRNNGMFSLGKGIETLAQSYSQAGYATGAFISAQVLVRRYGLDTGFDVYDDDLSRSRKIGTATVPSRTGDLTLARAEQWLESVDPDQPVFMWLHFYDPHAPYQPPEEFRKKFPGDPYGGEIAFTDDLIRRLGEYLDTKGRLKNSIINIVADHGEALGEHGEATHGVLLHQATIHVPWILVTPDRSHSLRIREPVSTVNVSALLAALTGVTPPNADHADACLDFFEAGREKPIYFEGILSLYQYGWSPLRGLRKGKWEIVRGKRDELFNLENDPRELSDLSQGQPMELEYLQKAMDQIEKEDSKLSLKAVSEVKPSEREALEALGYVGTAAAERRDPPDPRDLVSGHVHVESARALSAAGRWEEALVHLNKMLDEDPGNLSAINIKAQVFRQMGRLDDAEKILERGLALDPKNSDIVSGLCSIEWSRHNFEKVIELAKLGKKTRSPFSTFDALEVRALLRLGKMDEADDFLKRELKARPDDADLLVSRAILEMRRNEKEKAIRDLRKAIKIDPFHMLARKNLGQLLQQEENFDEAEKVYEQMLQIDPRDAPTLAALGNLKLSRDPATAIGYLEEAVRLAPGKIDYLEILSVAQLQAGKNEDAEAGIRRALRKKPGDPSLMNNLGIALIGQERYREATGVLRKVLQKTPNAIQARNNLAVSLAREGRLSEAEAEAQRVIREAPSYVDGIMTLASILEREGKYEKEYKLLSASKKASHDPLYELRLAIAASRTGRCRETLKILGPMEAEGALEDPASLRALERCRKTG